MNRIDRVRIHLIKVLILGSFTMIGLEGVSQDWGRNRRRSNFGNWNNTGNKKDGLFNLKQKGCVTVAYGIENIVPLSPKFSYYVYDSKFNNFYGGLDIQIGNIFGFVYQVGATAGFQFKFLSIENSLSKTIALNDNGVNSYWNTYNVKLGIEFYNVWVRFGPAIILDSEYDDTWDNDFEYLGFKYNIEVSYVTYF